MGEIGYSLPFIYYSYLIHLICENLEGSYRWNFVSKRREKQRNRLNWVCGCSFFGCSFGH